MDQKYENVETFLHLDVLRTLYNFFPKLTPGFFHAVYNASSWTYISFSFYTWIETWNNRGGVLQQNKNISILISNVIVLKMVKITLRPYLEQVSNRENIRQVWTLYFVI